MKQGNCVFFHHVDIDWATTGTCSDGPVSHLHHGDHAVIADGVGADGEVTRRVPADDPVDGVPVG